MLIKNDKTGATVQDAALPTMGLCAIANIIQRDWPNVYFGAEPYLRAMGSLSGMDDYYGQDSASSIVTYFLGNANAYRGPVARAVKAELKRRLGR